MTDQMTGATSRIPVFVITGFLGAGKTSLLNALLGAGALKRTAVIVNEFGEVGLDHLFVGIAGDGIIEMAGGCLCCTIRGELAGTLLDLKDRDIDRVVIETTGLADPVPVLQAILADAEVGRHFDLAGVVTLVDALNATSTVAEQREAAEQIAFADALIVTKTDMLSDEIRSEAMGRLHDLLRRLNPNAPILARENIARLASLFDKRLWLSENHDEMLVETPGDHAGHDHRHDHDINRHDERIVATTLRHDRPIPLDAMEAFQELIASAHGEHVLRLKGLVAVQGHDRPLAVHGVQGVFHEPEWLDAWPDDDRTTRIVAILRDMKPEFIQRLFAGFANIPMADTPDRAALTDNPLAIPGAPRR